MSDDKLLQLALGLAATITGALLIHRAYAGATVPLPIRAVVAAGALLS
jgi:hypothetical protein